MEKGCTVTAFEYGVDEKGQKAFIFSSMKAWAKINEENNKLQNKLDFLVGLKNAFNEVKSEKNLSKNWRT
ncbi:MAG: hypothetical protein ABIN01_04970 [Ferruginibacter sp.]